MTMMRVAILALCLFLVVADVAGTPIKQNKGGDSVSSSSDSEYSYSSSDDSYSESDVSSNGDDHQLFVIVDNHRVKVEEEVGFRHLKGCRKNYQIVQLDIH